VEATKHVNEIQIEISTAFFVASPASKRKTAMISREYGIEFGVDSIYKLMDQLTDNTIVQTKKIIHSHTTKLLKAPPKVSSQVVLKNLMLLSVKHASLRLI